MSETKERRLVRIQEISKILDVPVKTLYHAARRDAWPKYKIGRDVRFDLEEILALLRQASP